MGGLVQAIHGDTYGVAVSSGMATTPDKVFSTGAMEQHLDAHTRDRYTLGFITDVYDLARIEQHLRGCISCRAALETESDFVKAIRPISSGIANSELQ
jgi:hypothetical protein